MTIKNSSRPVVVGGLFLLALVWVAMMGVFSSVFGGGSAASGVMPIDDGSVKSTITNLSRGEEFDISLSAKVTDKADQVLSGLTEYDVDVYEDGELVEARNFMPAGKGAIRLALVVDYSRSMNGTKIIEARKAARALMRLMNLENDYVGLYFVNDNLFDSKRAEVLPVAPLTKQQWDSAIVSLVTSGVGEGTPMMKTMDLGLTGLSKVPGRKVLIALTDGMDTGEPEDIARLKKDLVDRAKEMKIPLYMVNMSKQAADVATMEEMAKETGGQYISVPKPEKLQEIFETIGQSLQNEYTLNYTSPNPVEDGHKRNVELVVRAPGGVGTKTSGSYNVPGVIAAGGGRESSASAAAGSGSILMVFLILSALLGVMLVLPMAFSRKPISDEGGAAGGPAQTAASSEAVQATRPAPAPRVAAAKPKAGSPQGRKPS